MQPNVHLQPMDRSNWRRALGVRSHLEQLEFVADHEPVALVILSKCYIRPGGLTWVPFAIVADDVIIGIVALAHSENACEMLHLLIDRSCQGRGLGTLAVAAILDHVRENLPQFSQLTLTVHPRNERARRLYESAGFVSTGEVRDGEVIWHFAFDHRRNS